MLHIIMPLVYKNFAVISSKLFFAFDRSKSPLLQNKQPIVSGVRYTKNVLCFLIVLHGAIYEKLKQGFSDLSTWIKANCYVKNLFASGR